jgi:Rieske Fe-S protein
MSAGPPSDLVRRRDFVALCARAAIAPLAPALAACASLAARPVTPVDGRLELALAHYPELGEPGGSVKLQPAGRVEPVYVLALDEGGFAALSPVCTHLGCTVDIQGARLVCPCHGSTYDRQGRVLQGPAPRPLARYRAEVSRDGVLVIDLRGAA